MTTYTIIHHDGYEIASGLTLIEAADAIMTSDGREWDIRKDTAHLGWTAWSRQQVANQGWRETVFYSPAADEAEANADISQQIVGTERMRGHCEAVTDEQFAAMKAGE